MSTVKEAMTTLIANQPDDSSYDEILKELAFARMINRGLADSDQGKTFTDAEVHEQITSWHE